MKKDKTTWEWWMWLLIGVIGLILCVGGTTCAMTIAYGQPARQTVHGILLSEHAGPSYITESDTLVLARMVIGSQTAGARQAGNTHHSDAAACRLWTAANMFTLQRENGIRWRSIGEAAGAYSTALAPRWRADGDCALPAFSALPICEPRRLARRARISSMSWETIATRFADLRGYIQRWAQGDVPPPAGCHRTVHTDGLWRRVTVEGVVQYGSNRFWPRPGRRGSMGWLPGHVRFVPPPPD